MDIQAVQSFTDRIIDNVETVIIGKRDKITMLMVALLCQGHVLIEDVPGTGKTMLARAVAASMGLSFKRLQCTPGSAAQRHYRRGYLQHAEQQLYL